MHPSSVFRAVFRHNYPFHHTLFFCLFNELVCVLLNSGYLLSGLHCSRQLISWVMSPNIAEVRVLLSDIPGKPSLHVTSSQGGLAHHKTVNLGNRHKIPPDNQFPLCLDAWVSAPLLKVNSFIAHFFLAQQT